MCPNGFERAASTALGDNRAESRRSNAAIPMLDRLSARAFDLLLFNQLFDASILAFCFSLDASISAFVLFLFV